jgi:hypothetical protein
MTNPSQPLQTNTPEIPFATPPKSKSKKDKYILYALIGVGVLALVLLILVLVFANRASSANNRANTAQKDGQKQGAEAQKALDDKKLADEKVKDSRTYTAPDFAGNFSLEIPKAWSLSITPNDGTITLGGISNPDQIDTKAEKYALRFSLKDQPYTSAKSPYDQQTKAKSATGKTNLSSQPVTVSGIEGTKYTGQIGSKIPNGTLILVPIRDKTFTIQTDDNAVYSTSFNIILATVKLNP